MNAPGITHAYVDARAGAAAGELLLLMQVGDEVTNLVYGTGPAPAATLTLQVGARRLVREQFNGRFPGLLQLEHAIAAVEDEVSKDESLPAQRQALVLLDEALYNNALRDRSAVDARIVLALEDVERWFNRLVAVVAGSPPGQQGIPDDPEFAARLLIVREALHHLKIHGLWLQAGPVG
jgi:hypothetical protein